MPQSGDLSTEIYIRTPRGLLSSGFASTAQEQWHTPYALRGNAPRIANSVWILRGRGFVWPLSICACGELVEAWSVIRLLSNHDSFLLIPIPQSALHPLSSFVLCTSSFQPLPIPGLAFTAKWLCSATELFRLRWLRLALHVSPHFAVFFHNSYFIIHNSPSAHHRRGGLTYWYNLPPARRLNGRNSAPGKPRDTVIMHYGLLRRTIRVSGPPALQRPPTHVTLP